MDFVCLFSIAGILFLCHGFCKSSEAHIAKDFDVVGWLVFCSKGGIDALSDILLCFIDCLIQKQETEEQLFLFYTFIFIL